MRLPPSRRVGAPALPLLVETRFGVPTAGPAGLSNMCRLCADGLPPSIGQEDGVEVVQKDEARPASKA